MLYIWSESNDAAYNMALEQYVFDNLSDEQDVFMLWQNENAIVVGVNQNTAAEINISYVRDNNISVVRRLSGGGAMYQDLGNVNFTFISKGKGMIYDFSSFIEPIIKALARLGITAVATGRNDVTVDGKKFSGNAQYKKSGKIMHHGTILFDSDLTVLSKALNVSSLKLESKGVKSVSSRVTNLRPLLQKDVDVKEFIDTLHNSIDEQFNLTTYILSDEDILGIETLIQQRYSTWDWNYSKSPPYTMRVEKRFDMVGTIEVLVNVKESSIEDISFFGDYFGEDDSSLKSILKGTRLLYNDLIAALEKVDIDIYFKGLDKMDFIELLLGI